MEGNNALTNISAARLVAPIFGILSGLGGIFRWNIAPDSFHLLRRI